MFSKVLYLAPNYKKRKGGIASVLKTYSNMTEDFNFQSSVSYQNIYLNIILFPLNILTFICKLIFNKQLEIIHIHGASRGSFMRKIVFFYISKVFNKKVVYHIHGAEYHLFYQDSSKVLKKFIHKVIENSDAIIVLSAEWRDYFTKTFKTKRIFVINNIVDYKEPNILESKKALVKFVFLGRVGARKGIYDLIEAIKNSKDSLEGKFVLKIGGDGEIEKLKECITKYKIDSLVEYIGWVSADHKEKLLKSSDVMIMPSYNEGLPISLLEAMSYTMPIISTNVGGIPQILKNGHNGKIVRPGNIEEIQKAILFYLNNRDTIKTHGENSYEIVKDFFPEKVKADLMKLYKSIL